MIYNWVFVEKGVVSNILIMYFSLIKLHFSVNKLTLNHALGFPNFGTDF